ncbi:Fe-S cluster assembly protein SufB [Candidatus Woesearchaeota archaeon]|nr:Fe-S cluster assembly protein SufB [Candidatus Woesearchaeota archaeon]MCF7901059.1 Fe-S cluster assembly protein SufB [Candidatus Woesearchaeota archaeon]MCF8013956.1 Fe-S cluster assembly protein SufB [Candidatus Woesearchaeota archaeon]
MEISRELYDHTDKTKYIFKVPNGINEEVVRAISKYKKEPEWMLNKRLQALKIFQEKKVPTWGPDLSKLDLNKICYYAIPDAKQNSTSWEDVPENIKLTFERLGIPEAERKALAGAGAQFDSQTVYHNLKEDLQKKGVIFEDMHVAVEKYPDLVKKYFMTQVVSPALHKYAALHGAVWSGGTFIYIPKGVKVDQPLQAYFRMNESGMGQFEHTLIIVEEDAECHYIEGCSAPKYKSPSIHAGCVEVIVHKGARMRYSSVENWSRNTYNLNTKRANIHENGIMEWVSGNLGSGVTMLYPASLLLGKNSQAHHITIAYAGPEQNQDTGAKIYHLAPNTTSTVKSKSISKDGGITAYRGIVEIKKGATNAKCSVHCDAMMFDNKSQSNTYPTIKVEEKDADMVHEATIGKISEDQIFYLMSRGLSEEEALKLIVSGFIEPLMKELPLEYAIEMNKLIQMEMEGNLG